MKVKLLKIFDLFKDLDPRDMAEKLSKIQPLDPKLIKDLDTALLNQNNAANAMIDEFINNVYKAPINELEHKFLMLIYLFENYICEYDGCIITSTLYARPDDFCIYFYRDGIEKCICFDTGSWSDYGYMFEFIRDRIKIYEK